ncbi:MAG: hypothetical protein PWR06_478 [Thermoanaerobacteraceae bacterium]|nr:hypothetical protein [Biomaibacter acetigenes]MDK2877762.1 hypothetical protein [Thermoanaerobacteraceae bacterium]MDN5311058.1 hypothetical protein [Thermoanaerobacteraceae bacterium]
MAENENNPRADLLNTVMDVIHGKRGQNINELVSLLALSNLLGIITFLNSQDLKLDMGSFSKSGNSDLKEMAMNLLGSMGSGSSDKKINPAMLLNLLKTLSPGESSSSEIKSGEKSEDKTKT